MKKLKPEEVQEGKVFHDGGCSVRVLRVEMRKSEGKPLQVVVFREIGNHTGEKALPMDAFCKQYQRKKGRI